MRRIPKLVLACVLWGATAFASCEQQRPQERAPRVFESGPELFVRDDPRTIPIREQLIGTTEPAPPPQAPPRAAKVARAPAKWLERALAEAREEEKPAPVEPLEPGLEPPAPPPRFLPPPPLPVKPPVPPAEPPKPNRRLTDATNVAIGVGALGVGMSAIAVGTGDGLEGEKWLAATWLGVGVAAFGTAGILYAIDPNPQKDKVNIMAGPGVVGVRGSF